MRWDMYEVIIERPRGGAGWGREGGRRRAWRRDPESAATREGISMSRGSKHLNENLAPLRRFLESRLGAPWSSVHSEICATLRPTSAVQLHVLQHLDQMVLVRAAVEDGQVIAVDRWGGLRAAWRGRWSRFYVCPTSGTLKLLPARPRPAAPADRDRAIVEGALWRRIEGVWYAIAVAPVPAALTGVRDAVLGPLMALGDRWAREGALREAYGRGDRYAASKRQLGKRELRRLPREVRG